MTTVASQIGPIRSVSETKNIINRKKMGNESEKN